MDEEIIKEVDVDDIGQNIKPNETVEYIEVNELEPMEIEIEEAVGWTGGNGDITHASLPDKNEPDQHAIESIKGLSKMLDILSSAKDHYSPHSGFAEFRQWKSKNGGIARFVSLVSQDEKDKISGGNTFIELCDTGHLDVYGVTVANSAVCGYQKEEYRLLDLNVGNDGDIITDNNEVLNCTKVCLLGVVQVRQGALYHPNGRDAQVGDYVVPGAEGCAVYSENGVGFRVVAVGQLTGATDPQYNYRYVDIALVPQNDNVARVMAELEGTKQNLGNLSIQIGKLEDEIDKSITSVIPGINEALGDLNGAVSDTQDKLEAAQDALDAAQDISKKANEAIDTTKKEYMDAISDAQETIEQANSALADVSKGVISSNEELSKYIILDTGDVLPEDEIKTYANTNLFP